MIFGTPPIVTNGLVLNLDAANTKSYVSGSTNWFNLGDSSISGSLINNPGFSADGGGSMTFNGSNNYISVKDIDITSQISVEAWVYANSLGSYNGIVTQYSTSNPSTSSWILETFGSSAYFFIANGSNLYSGLIAFSTGVWTHLMGVYNGSSITIYQNGIAGTSTATSVLINNSALKINIGALYSSGGVEGGDGRWNGKISSVRLYNRGLTIQEVQQNYNALKSRYGLR
jgi:hypothetical protein